jgi:hypothetical protein
VVAAKAQSLAVSSLEQKMMQGHGCGCAELWHSGGSGTECVLWYASVGGKCGWV